MISKLNMMRFCVKLHHDHDYLYHLTGDKNVFRDCSNRTDRDDFLDSAVTDRTLRGFGGLVIIRG